MTPPDQPDRPAENPYRAPVEGQPSRSNPAWLYIPDGYLIAFFVVPVLVVLAPFLFRLLREVL